MIIPILQTITKYKIKYNKIMYIYFNKGFKLTQLKHPQNLFTIAIKILSTF
jgi:hypothetical protein